MTAWEVGRPLYRRLINPNKSARLCLSCARRYRQRPTPPEVRALFSTSSPRLVQPEALESIQAAPEIDFNTRNSNVVQNEDMDNRMAEDRLRKLRIVPASPSYFTARPTYTDDLIRLQAVLQRWQRLPTTTTREAPRAVWMSFEEYQGTTNQEVIKRSRYGAMVAVLKRLNLILPEMRPKEVVDTLQRFEQSIDPALNKPNPILIDEWGRARAIGRRKESSAQVWLVEGEGEVLINGKTLAEAFSRVHDRESVVWALKATDRLDKYNIWALVRGGGTTGQAEALTLGVSKALMAHEPDLKKTLRTGESIEILPLKFRLQSMLFFFSG